MGQTLYAIIAMMIVSLFAMQQQRSALRAQLDMIDNEIAMISSGVAVERLEEIGALAFDQNTRGGETADSPNDLTPPAEFGAGYDQTGDDLDDFHATLATLGRPLGEDSLWFDVVATVDYVQESNHDQVAPSATKFKRVTVTVRVDEDAPANAGILQMYDAEGLAERAVTLSQLYSCKSACQW